MKGTIRSRLLKSFDGGVYGLARGGESTCRQRLDMLGVAYLRACINYLLSGFEEFLGELSELENFSFDEWVSQPSHRLVD